MSQRHWGIFETLCAKALNWLQRSFDAEVLLVCRRPLVPEQPIPEDVRGRYRFAVLTRAELLAFSADPELGMSPESVERGCNNQDLCVGVLEHGRLVAYCWYAIRGSALLSTTLDIHFDHAVQAYGYKMFTAPSHRGLRLQLYNARFGDTELARRGYTHSIGYVRVQNWASRRSLARIPDNVTVGRVFHARCFGRPLSLVTPGAVRYGVRLSDRVRRPAIAAQRGLGYPSLEK